MSELPSTRSGRTIAGLALREEMMSVVKLSCPRFLWTPYCSEKLEDRQHGR